MTKTKINNARKHARAIAKEHGLTHQQALDALAEREGHAHWGAMKSAISAQEVPQDVDPYYQEPEQDDGLEYYKQFVPHCIRAGLPHPFFQIGNDAQAYGEINLTRLKDGSIIAKNNSEEMIDLEMLQDVMGMRDEVLSCFGEWFDSLDNKDRKEALRRAQEAPTSSDHEQILFGSQQEMMNLIIDKESGLKKLREVVAWEQAAFLLNERAKPESSRGLTLHDMFFGYAFSVVDGIRDFINDKPAPKFNAILNPRYTG